MRASGAQNRRIREAHAGRYSRPQAWNLLQVRHTNSRPDAAYREDSLWSGRLPHRHPRGPHPGARILARMTAVSPVVCSYVCATLSGEDAVQPYGLAVTLTEKTRPKIISGAPYLLKVSPARKTQRHCLASAADLASEPEQAGPRLLP